MTGWQRLKIVLSVIYWLFAGLFAWIRVISMLSLKIVAPIAFLAAASSARPQLAPADNQAQPFNAAPVLLLCTGTRTVYSQSFPSSEPMTFQLLIDAGSRAVRWNGRPVADAAFSPDQVSFVIPSTAIHSLGLIKWRMTIERATGVFHGREENGTCSVATQTQNLF